MQEHFPNIMVDQVCLQFQEYLPKKRVDGGCPGGWMGRGDQGGGDHPGRERPSALRDAPGEPAPPGFIYVENGKLSTLLKRAFSAEQTVANLSTMDGCEQPCNNQPVRLADTLARGGGSSNIQSNLIRCDEREAVSDTLGKSASAHRARGPTPHEGWAPHMRWVGNRRRGLPPLTHKPLPPPTH